MAILEDVFNHALYTQHLNSSFRIHHGDEAPLETELITVSELTAIPTQEYFSITLRGPNHILLRQKIYRVEHDQIGEFDLFLVPVKQDNTGIYYEAVFNRFKTVSK